MRFKTDEYFNNAALASFAAYTGSHEVKLVHVDSAAAMKKVIENGPWDVVIYFGMAWRIRWLSPPRRWASP